MQVVKGDLTKQQVTGIVNPTNTHLARGGASDHIAKAAGPGFAKNCDAVLARQGSLAEGSSGVSQAGGALRCRYIIHAAGPHYTGNLSAVTALVQCVAFGHMLHFHAVIEEKKRKEKKSKEKKRKGKERKGKERKGKERKGKKRKEKKRKAKQRLFDVN